MSQPLDPMLLEAFIDKALIPALKLMVDTPTLQYFSFGPMAAAIEFLGACHPNDADPIRSKSAKPPVRFENGLDLLDASSAHKYKATLNKASHNLYVNMRCGMAHVLLPQGDVTFTTRAEQKQLAHLGVTPGGKLVLVAEDLYDDVATALTALSSWVRTARANNKLPAKLGGPVIHSGDYP